MDGIADLRHRKCDAHVMHQLRLELHTWGRQNVFALSDDDVVNLFVNSGRQFDEQFMLKDKTGRPLSNVPYTARFATGKIVHDRTDANGRTRRFKTFTRDAIHIYIGHRQF